MADANSAEYGILIVDDNPDDIRLLKDSLRSADARCQILSFIDAEDALHYIETFAGSPVALRGVVLDMHMPKIDGSVLASAVRASSFLAQVPIIVLSSSISRFDRERMKAFNVAEHIEKPMGLQQFLQLGQTITQLLGQAWH